MLPSLPRRRFGASLTQGVLLGGLAMAGRLHAAPPVIAIAAEDDWPPYSSRRPGSNEPEGFTPELVRAVFKHKGVEVKFMVLPFSRCLLMVKSGKVVAGFNTARTDENRDEYLWHTTPIFEEGTSIFGLAEDPRSEVTLKALEGSSVGVTTGYLYADDFMHNTRIKKFEANSDDHLLKMLLAKRVPYIALNTLPGLLRIKAEKGLSSKVKLLGTVGKNEFWLNFSKAHPDGKPMAEVFASGLQEFKANGRYQQMMADFKLRLGLSK